MPAPAEAGRTRALQYRFAGYLRDPEHAAPLPDVERRRLDLYAELVFNNVEELLAANFPVIRSLHEDEAWHALVRDFYREFAVHLDAKTRQVIESTLDEDRSEFVVARVRAGIEADHLIAGRLALWGRRIMGEALTQTQHVAAERDALSDVLAGDVIGGLDLASIADIFGRITQRHIERMGKLGLEH